MPITNKEKITPNEVEVMNHTDKHSKKALNFKEEYNNNVPGWFCGCGFYSPEKEVVERHIREMGAH